MAHSTPKDPMAKPLLIGGLALIGATVFVLVSNLLSTIEKNSVKGAEDNTRQLTLAEANLEPIGTVTAVDKSVAKEPRSGEEVYNAVCTSCHTTGVLGAPKLGDKGAWDSRLGQGLEGLLNHAINGINNMPARGGDPSITDEELNNAIVYMLGKAGHDLSGEVQAAPAKDEAPTASAEQAAAPATAVASGIDGEKVYKGICFSCHDNGVANAPKLDDKEAWTTRMEIGIEAVYGNAINGKGAMPAKGGNPTLSDDEIKAAVDYMIAQSGVSAGQAAVPAAAEAIQEETPAEQAAAPAEEAAPTEQAAAPAIDGEKVYRGICFSCHDVGIANSPKLGDKEAWAPRIATSIDALYNASINGKGVMPAKGGNPALSDEEIKAAVDYMVSQAQ